MPNHLLFLPFPSRSRFQALLKGEGVGSWLLPARAVMDTDLGSGLGEDH